MHCKQFAFSDFSSLLLTVFAGNSLQKSRFLMPWMKIVTEIPSEVGRSAQDDWTGKASAAERRKIQNRVNVRAHRMFVYDLHLPFDVHY
jgi:hypothetical protein